MPTLADRYRGALLGLAAGDALGTTLEFKPPGTFEPILDMVGGGPFNLQPGQWTDDTSMALCLAESLIESNGFDPVDQLARYLRWKREGHHSATGRCFDIGGTVMAASPGSNASASHGPATPTSSPPATDRSCGLRRCRCFLPRSRRRRSLARRTARGRRTERGNRSTPAATWQPLSSERCREHHEKTILAPIFTPVPILGSRPPRAENSRHCLRPLSSRDPPHIRGTGYVVESLEVALWAFAKSTSFEHGALLAVNLGDDADTTGAVYRTTRGRVLRR